MKKTLLKTSLWGVLTLSLLSSCRTEDGVTTQKQAEDKRFAVFVPKSGETINYANGFAYLMQRYDKKQKTNLSGINNTIVINAPTASTDKRPVALTIEKSNTYVEFNIRTETFTEENGNKWVIFPKVKESKVIGVVVAILKDNETSMRYLSYDMKSELYKEYQETFQEALDKYQKRRTMKLIAGIKPMAISEIEEVVITVPRKTKRKEIDFPRTIEDEVGKCQDHANCIDYNPGGGGSGSGEDLIPEKVDEINITELKDYPCAFSVAQELPNLENNIAKILADTFEINEKINVTFKADKSMKDTEDGYTEGKGSITNKTLDMTISLNANMLGTATKEYILVTMYHEVIHAYLSYQRLNLGKEAFDKEYPKVDCYEITNSKGEIIQRFSFINENLYDAHPRFTNFISSLENAISAYNPNLSKDVVKSLVRSGIFSDLTDSEIALNQNERDTSKGLSKGTKCP